MTNLNKTNKTAKTISENDDLEQQGGKIDKNENIKNLGEDENLVNNTQLNVKEGKDENIEQINEEEGLFFIDTTNIKEKLLTVEDLELRSLEIYKATLNKSSEKLEKEKDHYNNTKLGPRAKFENRNFYQDRQYKRIQIGLTVEEKYQNEKEELAKVARALKKEEKMIMDQDEPDPVEVSDHLLRCWKLEQDRRDLRSRSKIRFEGPRPDDIVLTQEQMDDIAKIQAEEYSKMKKVITFWNTLAWTNLKPIRDVDRLKKEKFKKLNEEKFGDKEKIQIVRESFDLLNDWFLPNTEAIQTMKNILGQPEREDGVKQLTGAFILLDSLARNNTTDIFGYPGGAILPIYDELFYWEKNKTIKHYLTRHEQGAVHAADGYARASGKVGVCFATSGPGATNLVTGIATAQLDSIPLVVITGQVGKSLIGTDAFQEIDTFGITLPIVKHSFITRNAKSLSRIISEAFYIAKTGRPGPVLIDIPKDVGAEIIPHNEYFPILPKSMEEILGPRLKVKQNVSKTDLTRTINTILAAKQPLLYVGGGVITSGATKQLQDFAEILQIPVTTTLMGKGAFPESKIGKDGIRKPYSLSLGMLGMHGTAYANFAVSNCDLLFAIGARFDDRVTGKLEEFACNAFIIHLDIDQAEIHKNKPVDISLVGDAKHILNLLIDEVTTKQSMEYLKLYWQTTRWHERIADWKLRYPLSNLHVSPTLTPQEVIDKIGKITPQAYFTTDVGQHQMWSAQFLQCQPRRWLSSSGLGTMGYGVPAAIGAQIAFPNDLVICISGDASFQMNLQELGTISQYNLPIKIVVINNHWQGMVRQWQQAFYEGRYSQSNMEKGAPDLLKLGEVYGIQAIRITNRNNIDETLNKSLNSSEPVLIEICVNEIENCYPMIEPGQSNSGMVIDGKQINELDNDESNLTLSPDKKSD
ncbi:unnamed protein product [Chrysoparadoxa australica]